MQIPTLPRLAVVLLFAAASPLAGQTATGRIEGEASDSAHGRPLAGATVLVTRVSPKPSEFFSAGTDDKGRFMVDGLASGHYLVGLSHPFLDSLEISMAPQELDLAEGKRARIDFALPSAATLHRAACPGIAWVKGTGALAGRVTDAGSERPIAGAVIVVEWAEIGLDRRRMRPTRTVRSGEVRTDAGGHYHLCGVPTDERITLQVQQEGRVGSAVTVMVPGDATVLVQNISFSAASARAAGDSSSVGLLTGRAVATGRVRAGNGRPVAGVQVHVSDAAPAAVSDSLGRYLLADLPAGTQLLEARKLGYAEVRQPVELRNGDTASADVVIERVTSLDSVRVVGRRVKYSEFERDKALASGFGWFLDQADLAKRNVTEASDLVKGMAGFRVMGSGLEAKIYMSRGQTSISAPPCAVDVVIDGVPGMDINFVNPDQIARVELHPGLGTAPLQYTKGCGVIVIWTKR